jgi:3-oxoacyl-ACP reductase-like protein
LEIRNIPLDEAVQGFKEGIEAPATTVAIVSSEYFYYADPAAVVPAVREMFGLDVDVVVYIRSQADLVVSGYNQDVKRLGKTVPRPAPQYHRLYDWSALLDAWAKELGKDHLKAISFDLSARKHTLLDDFVASACPEIGKEFERGAFERNTFYNESLPADLLEFKRVANTFGGSGLYDYQWLEEALRAGYTGPRFGISAEEANQWRAIYRDSNEYAAREYFSGATADEIFPVSEDREPGVDLEGKLPIETLAKLLAFAVRRHEDYRKTTNERMRALERQIAALRARLQ